MRTLCGTGSNGFLGFNEKRVWNVIRCRFGGYVTWGNSTHDNEIAANIGILNTFRLGKRLDLTLEGRQMLVKESFDGTVSGSKGEGMSGCDTGAKREVGQDPFRPRREVLRQIIHLIMNVSTRFVPRTMI